MRRLVSIFITGVMVTTAIVMPVNAQTTGQSANGFRISPVRNELTIEKGKSQTVSIYIENPSNLPLKAKALINDFIASEKEDGQPQLLLDGSSAKNHSFKKLVQAVPATDLAGRERKEVKITVTIPSDATAGGYYGAVRFVPADEKSGANVALTASVGSLFLVNVPGNIKEHLELVQFSAASKGSARKIIFGGPVSIITRLKNDGDTHEKPYGKIQVKDRKGAVVADEEINNIEPQSNILPGSIRKFETKLSKSNWLGRYSVTASYGYNPSAGELINAETTFWYIPLWLLATGSVVLLVLLYVGYIAYRKINVKRSRSHR